jgi:hypothetical protein
MVLLTPKQPNFKCKLSCLKAAHKVEEGQINDLISLQNPRDLVNPGGTPIARKMLKTAPCAELPPERPSLQR